MAQIVNGTEFPDDATPAEIEAFFAEEAGRPTQAQIDAPNRAVSGSLRRVASDMAPHVLGLLGGMGAGALVAGPPGAAAGAAAGGIRGALMARAASGGIRSALMTGAAETAGAAAGGALGGALSGRPAENAAEQAIFAAPGAAFPLGARGAAGLARRLRSNAQRKAVEDVVVSERARDVTQMRRSQREEAIAGTAAGGEAQRALLKASKAPKITLGEIVDGVVTRTGIKASPAARRALAAEIRDMIRDARKVETHGLIDERRVTFDPVEANEILRTLQSMARTTFNAESRGIKPRPDLAASSAKVLRNILNERVPGLEDIKRATQLEIKSSQGLAKREVTPREAAVVLASKTQAAAERAGRIGAPIRAHFGFGPRALGTGMSVDPMSTADLIARLLGDPGIEGPRIAGRAALPLAIAVRTIPRGFAAADDLLNYE